MELWKPLSIIVIAIIGTNSLNLIGKHLPKRRRKYAYLYFEETPKVPRWALIHFWIWILSFALIVVIIYY
jgi:hypothetical protein